MTPVKADLETVLTYLSEIVAAGKPAYDADPRQRWSVERLWIFAGNLAERHLRQTAAGNIDPIWRELIAARNVYAHYTPSAINYDRVWADTFEDLARVQVAVAGLQE